MYDDESSTLWALRGGKRYDISKYCSVPFMCLLRALNRPKCGFDGLACPVGVWEAYFVYIVCGSVTLFIIFALVIGLIVATVRCVRTSYFPETQ